MKNEGFKPWKFGLHRLSTYLSIHGPAPLWEFSTQQVPLRVSQMYIPLLKQEIWMVIFMDLKSGRSLLQSPQRLVQWMFNMFLEEQWSGLTAAWCYPVVATSHLARCWFVCHWALKIMMWCPSAQRWQAGQMSFWSGRITSYQLALALRMHAVAPPPVVALCWPGLGSRRKPQSAKQWTPTATFGRITWWVPGVVDLSFPFLNTTQHKFIIVSICLFIYIYMSSYISQAAMKGRVVAGCQTGSFSICLTSRLYHRVKFETQSQKSHTHDGSMGLVFTCMNGWVLLGR